MWEEDVRNGRVEPVSDTFDSLRAMLREGRVVKYSVVRTDTADAHIRRIVLFVAEKFGNETALEKLDRLENEIRLLEDNPLLGEIPKYPSLKRRGYRYLGVEKSLIFYKTDETRHMVIIHAVFDQRQDYLSIIRGL